MFYACVRSKKYFGLLMGIAKNAHFLAPKVLLLIMTVECNISKPWSLVKLVELLIKAIANFYNNHKDKKETVFITTSIL